MQFNIYYHLDEDTAERLCRIENLLGTLLDQPTIMELLMPLIDDLQAKADATLLQVQKNGDLEDSILAIVTADAQTILDLKAALDAAGTDPAKLQALSNTMDAIAAKTVANGQKAADAVIANTPAATPPADVPPADVPPADVPPAA